MSNPFGNPGNTNNNNPFGGQQGGSDPFALGMGIGGGLSNDHHLSSYPNNNQQNV